MTINREKFFASYRKVFGSIKQSVVDALDILLDAIEADPQIDDERQLSYILATIHHETYIPRTGQRYEPVEEIGKGRGKPYGKADPETGEAYYGRGFVQLTWRKNYEVMGRLLGIDLVNEPSLALDPSIAWQITSEGMRQGLFTRKKLRDYINDNTCDYVNARRIINGTDKASLIASYAKKFEKVLADSLEDAASDAQLPVDAPKDEAPTQTVEPTATGTQVNVGANALVDPTKPIVSQPGDPAVNATTGGFKSLMTSVVGWVTGAGAGVIALLKDNMTLLIIAAVLVALAGLAYFIRQLILDHKRLEISSDPTKYNAR